MLAEYTMTRVENRCGDEIDFIDEGGPNIYLLRGKFTVIVRHATASEAVECANDDGYGVETCEELSPFRVGQLGLRLSWAR